MSNPSGVLRRVFARRRWPAVPAPTTDPASLQQAVSALKDRAQVQSREAGNVGDSFATIQDLISVGVVSSDGRTLESRVSAIEARLKAAGIP